MNDERWAMGDGRYAVLVAPGCNLSRQLLLIGYRLSAIDHRDTGS
jgi:hypothetical protein